MKSVKDVVAEEKEDETAVEVNVEVEEARNAETAQTAMLAEAIEAVMVSRRKDVRWAVEETRLIEQTAKTKERKKAWASVEIKWRKNTVVVMRK